MGHTDGLNLLMPLNYARFTSGH